MGELIEGVKDITEFLEGAFKACEKHSLIKAIAESSPWWVKGIAEGLSESLPVVGFIAKTMAKFLIPDQEHQGRIACTLAYQRSIEQSINAMQGRVSAECRFTTSIRRAVTEAKISDVPLTGFSLDARALGHPFVNAADAAIREFAAALSLSSATTNSLVSSVHGLFLSNLAIILSHPRTEDKFKHFAQHIKYEATSQRGRRALALHNHYTLWRYERAPVLGDEPFALTHIYTEIDCGELLWNDVSGPAGRRDQSIGGAKKKNPFSETDAPRKPLLGTVLGLLARPSFREPIVIQGVAGAGKSSFTLRLAAELMQSGLVPIRIELGDVDVTRSIEESFPRALRFSSAQFHTEGWDPELSAEDFKELLFSQESTEVGEQKAHVSPYVVILDGWDEIVTGASRGFRDDVEKMLDEVRERFFGAPHRNDPQVHVIITGRPTADVTKTKLLREHTPFLTVRPFSPDQLEMAVQRFLIARRECPLSLSSTMDGTSAANAASTSDKVFLEPRPAWCEAILDEYRQRFTEMQSRHERKEVDVELSGSMAVLGMPLLAQLALRLIGSISPTADIHHLIGSPCTLYRALIDMTHFEAGKPSVAKLTEKSRHRLTGPGLRSVLWEVARAITALGGEEISRKELSLRINWERVGEVLGVEGKVDDRAKDEIISGLVISFFMMEGKYQGCRFLHKSFREYLFSEGLVETLKRYGRNADVARAYSSDPQGGLPERAVYWKDFDDHDPRRRFIRTLADACGTTWISREVQQYVTDLVSWEVERSVTPESGCAWSGETTVPLTFEEWKYVRDGLADTWDWWAEGVALRCIPVETKKGVKDLDAPSGVEIAERCSPLNPDLWQDEETPDVVRITTVDSRLGDAFFLLAAVVHGAILWHQFHGASIDLAHRRPRRYQSYHSVQGGSVARFRPTGESSEYFGHFIARINAAGWRPLGRFPTSANLTGVDLRQTAINRLHATSASFEIGDLRDAWMSGGAFAHANFYGANLNGASLARSQLRNANLSDAKLRKTMFMKAECNGASFRNADLYKARFSGAEATGADFNGANCEKAKFIGAIVKSANLEDANLAAANLESSDFGQSRFHKSSLRNAQLRNANLCGAIFTEADLSGAELSRANLSKADLSNANLSCAILRGTILTRANLSGADLTGAVLRNADIRGTDLREVLIKESQLQGAIRSESTLLPEVFLPESEVDELKPP